MMKRRLIPFAIVFFALAAFVSCRNGPLKRLERNPAVLAVVGRYYVERADLKASLAYNQAGKTKDPAVLSRILDGLLNDVLVLNDIAKGPAPGEPGPLGLYSDPRAIKMAIAPVLESKVYNRVTVRKGQVEAYYVAHIKQYRKGPGVLLRTILLSGPKQAKEAATLLRRGHSFVGVARLYSVSPKKGALQYFEYGELPDYLLPVVKDAKVGVATAPVEVSSEFLQIVCVEKRFKRYVVPLEKVKSKIRLALADAESARYYQAYLERLKGRFPIRVFWSKLPFTYGKEGS